MNVVIMGGEIQEALFSDTLSWLLQMAATLKHEPDRESVMFSLPVRFVFRSFLDTQEEYRRFS